MDNCGGRFSLNNATLPQMVFAKGSRRIEKREAPWVG